MILIDLWFASHLIIFNLIRILQKRNKKSMQYSIASSQTNQKLGHNVATHHFWRHIFPQLYPPTIRSLQSKDWSTMFPQQFILALPEISHSECEEINLQFFIIEKKSQKPQVSSNLHSVLNLLSRTTFASLKILKLNFCLIENIETLAFLDIEQLENIEMASNIITCLKPMNKLNLPRLAKINLFSNKFNTFMMQRAKISTQHLDNLNIQGNKEFAIVQNTSLILKLNSPKIKILQLPFEKDCVFRRKPVNKFFDRYPGIGISSGFLKCEYKPF